jgi:hypothetical protein
MGAKEPDFAQLGPGSLLQVLNEGRENGTRQSIVGRTGLRHGFPPGSDHNGYRDEEGDAVGQIRCPRSTPLQSMWAVLGHVAAAAIAAVWEKKSRAGGQPSPKKSPGNPGRFSRKVEHRGSALKSLDTARRNASTLLAGAVERGTFPRYD